MRWTGQVEALYSQTYTFYASSDDGIRLWVNGQQIINNWTDHGRTQNSGTIALTAGQRGDIRLEFYEDAGNAIAQLSWASSSQAKQIIPPRSSIRRRRAALEGPRERAAALARRAAETAANWGPVAFGTVGARPPAARLARRRDGHRRHAWHRRGAGGGGTTNTGGTPGTGGTIAIPTHCTGALPAGAQAADVLIPPP